MPKEAGLTKEQNRELLKSYQQMEESGYSHAFEADVNVEQVTKQNKTIDQILKLPTLSQIGLTEKSRERLIAKANRNRAVFLVKDEKLFGDSTHMVNVKNRLKELEAELAKPMEETSLDQVSELYSNVLEACRLYLGRRTSPPWWPAHKRRYNKVLKLKESLEQESNLFRERMGTLGVDDEAFVNIKNPLAVLKMEADSVENLATERSIMSEVLGEAIRDPEPLPPEPEEFAPLIKEDTVLSLNKNINYNAKDYEDLVAVKELGYDLSTEAKDRLFDMELSKAYLEEKDETEKKNIATYGMKLSEVERTRAIEGMLSAKKDLSKDDKAFYEEAKRKIQWAKDNREYDRIIDREKWTISRAEEGYLKANDSKIIIPTSEQTEDESVISQMNNRVFEETLTADERRQQRFTEGSELFKKAENKKKIKNHLSNKRRSDYVRLSRMEKDIKRLGLSDVIPKEVYENLCAFSWTDKDLLDYAYLSQKRTVIDPEKQFHTDMARRYRMLDNLRDQILMIDEKKLSVSTDDQIAQNAGAIEEAKKKVHSFMRLMELNPEYYEAMIQNQYARTNSPGGIKKVYSMPPRSGRMFSALRNKMKKIDSCYDYYSQRKELLIDDCYTVHLNSECSLKNLGIEIKGDEPQKIGMIKKVIRSYFAQIKFKLMMRASQEKFFMWDEELKKELKNKEIFTEEKYERFEFKYRNEILDEIRKGKESLIDRTESGDITNKINQGYKQRVEKMSEEEKNDLAKRDYNQKDTQTEEQLTYFDLRDRYFRTTDWRETMTEGLATLNKKREDEKRQEKERIAQLEKEKEEQRQREEQLEKEKEEKRRREEQVKREKEEARHQENIKKRRERDKNADKRDSKVIDAQMDKLTTKVEQRIAEEKRQAEEKKRKKEEARLLSENLRKSEEYTKYKNKLRQDISKLVSQVERDLKKGTLKDNTLIRQPEVTLLYPIIKIPPEHRPVEGKEELVLRNRAEWDIYDIYSAQYDKISDKSLMEKPKVPDFPKGYRGDISLEGIQENMRIHKKELEQLENTKEEINKIVEKDILAWYQGEDRRDSQNFVDIGAWIAKNWPLNHPIEWQGLPYEDEYRKGPGIVEREIFFYVYDIIDAQKESIFKMLKAKAEENNDQIQDPLLLSKLDDIVTELKEIAFKTEEEKKRYWAYKDKKAKKAKQKGQQEAEKKSQQEEVKKEVIKPQDDDEDEILYRARKI